MQGGIKEESGSFFRRGGLFINFDKHTFPEGTFSFASGLGKTKEWVLIKLFLMNEAGNLRNMPK